MIYQLLFSGTGRTENVMNIVSSQWDCDKHAIDLSAVEFIADKYSFSDHDLCILAVPVYGGRIPIPAAEKIKKLQGNGAKALLVAVFGNRAVDDCLLEMRDIMVERGFVPVAAIEASVQHSILMMVEPDRPDASDVDELKSFANTVKKLLIERTGFGSLRVPGNYPYCAVTGHPIQPEGNETCNACGFCVKSCPMRAISAENPRGTDSAMCISCMRCTAVCPVGARNFPDELLAQAYESLRPVFECRKPNKLYLAD